MERHRTLYNTLISGMKAQSKNSAFSDMLSHIRKRTNISVTEIFDNDPATIRFLSRLGIISAPTRSKKKCEIEIFFPNFCLTASSRALKQLKPSETTLHPGERCCTAQECISALENAATWLNRIETGLPALFVVTAATKGIFPVAPRPRLPSRFLFLPGHWLPRSLWKIRASYA